jgi:hypothetical protein
MRLGSFRARFSCLWLLLLDLRFLRTDLRIVWIDVPRDTTMMVGRLTLFAGILLDRLWKFNCWYVIGYILLDKITSIAFIKEDAFSRVYTFVLFFKKTLRRFQGS